MTYTEPKWLQERFDLYNRTYFRGRLPRYRVKMSNDGLVGGAHGICDYKRSVIRLAGWMPVIVGQKDAQILDRLSQTEKLRLLMVHEMAHIGGPPFFNHGKRWQARLLRADALGCKGAAEEAARYAEANRFESWNEQQRDLRARL